MASRKTNAPGPFARSVAAEIRALMGYKRISHMELAAAAQMSQNYLSKRLRDEMAFTLTDIESISPQLGVTPSQLVNAAGERLRKLGGNGAPEG